MSKKKKHKRFVRCTVFSKLVSECLSEKWLSTPIHVSIFFPLLCLARRLHIVPVFFLWSSSYSCMFLLPLELMRIGVASFGVLSSSVLVFFWAFLADTDWRQQLWQFRKSIGFLVDSLVVLSWVSLVSCRYLLLGFDVVYVICFCMFLDWFQLGFSSFQLCFHPF